MTSDDLGLMMAAAAAAAVIYRVGDVVRQCWRAYMQQRQDT
jgi:hypothetical protein